MAHPGARISYQSNTGTIRYTGTVDGSAGTWIGVEWDNPKRGKHSGVHNGKQYFTCRTPNSASFIRQSAMGLSYGRPFLPALLEKYVETLPIASSAVESVVLGSSKGAITVEAPRLDKIRANLSRVETLREISLDGELVSGAGEDEENIRTMCYNLKGLNLSTSLIPTWDVVARIVSNLPLLESLNLDLNRFARLEAPLSLISSALKDLHLNKTMMSWDELPFLSASFPALESLVFGYNHLADLYSSGNLPLFPNLTLLNLDGNQLGDWDGITRVLASLSRLERLILSSNVIPFIPLPSPPSRTNSSPVRQLVLTSNLIASWSSIDALSAWFPVLGSLNVNDNPVMDDPMTKRYAQQIVTARIPTLLHLNGTSIGTYERKDAEVFYLSFIVQSLPDADDTTRTKEHPRWAELCREHGVPLPAHIEASDKMKDRLIHMTLYTLTAPPSSQLSTLPMHSVSFPLRVLPTMMLRTLRLKILKTLKIQNPVKRIDTTKLWVFLLKESGGWVTREMEPGDDGKEIGWWGIEEGCGVGVLLDSGH